MHLTMSTFRLPGSGPRSRRSVTRTATAATGALALAGAVLATGTTPTADAATTSTPTGTTSVSGWRLDMSDDFGSLNTNRWNVKDRAANRNEESYLLRRNVTIDGGALRIQGKKESAGGRKYTSGYVDSRRKYTLPNYFRVELRAKVPLEMGMWAAPMWFRPADGSGGEIDLVETYGADLKKFGQYRVHHTVHNAYGSGHQTNQKQAVFPGDPLAWHVFTIEKTKGRIAMYVDGQQKGVWNQGDPSWFNQYFEAGKRWAMIMNLQIGGHRGSPDWSTNWAADRTAIKVDYVRTWVKG